MPYVYIVTDSDKAAAKKWKVGHTTRDIFKRVNEYKTMLPGVYLCFCHKTLNSKCTEKQIHEYLELLGYEREIIPESGRKSEWFTASSEQELIKSVVEVLYSVPIVNGIIYNSSLNTIINESEANVSSS